jgi:hypothetical protein
MRTQLTASEPQKHAMIAFPLAVITIVLCGVAATIAPQPGSRQLPRTVEQYPTAEAPGSVSPLAQADVPAAR